MEKGIDAYIKEQFHLPPVDIRTYSPLTLAYIGDGIYDLIIRSIIVGKGNTKASRLHQETSKLVRAQAQSEMIDLLLPYLSEEETDIYRRGRNAKSPTMAKNATMTDYRKATGFEALMGYLYLKDEFERMVELIKNRIRRRGRRKGTDILKSEHIELEALKIEGRNAVLEAFRSGKPIDKLFVLDRLHGGPVQNDLKRGKKA